MVAKTRVRFRNREFVRAMRASSLKGLERAAVFFNTRLRQEVSVSAGPSRGPQGGIVYTNPSKPGEFPHLRTGAGRDNTVWETNKNPKRPATRVGVRVNALYMHWLERDHARKYLLGGLRKYWRRIAAMFKTGATNEMRRRR